MMARAIHIQNAKMEDAGFIATLSGQLGYETTESEMQARLQKLLNTDDNCVYLAIDRGRILGWIHGLYALRVESDPFVEIAGLVVDEQSRKLGIGKMLIETVIKWAEVKKCTMIRVRTNTIRTESHRFYEKTGFTLKKEQKIYDKIIL